jgi:hypothetical protein
MMRLTIKWDNDDTSPDLAVNLEWGSHTARLEARSFGLLAEMVGREILGCLDEEKTDDELAREVLSAAAELSEDEWRIVELISVMHRADRKFEH